MSNLQLQDTAKLQDDSSLNNHRRHGTFHDGHVVAKIHGTDITAFEKWNKVILDGSMFTASKHFDIIPPVNLPTYNTALNLENIIPLSPKQQLDSLVYLFCVGTSGCGSENSQVYDVDYSKWIAPEDLVPFRYQLADNDLGSALRDKYFGRKVIDSANRIAYYFKAFDLAPTFKCQYTDGTPVDENAYISDVSVNIETYVELKMSITKDDCRDFFIANQGINAAKINTISLCTAYPLEYNGHIYYQGIRPLTRLNFPNESLIDLTKGIDITYDIFY